MKKTLKSLFLTLLVAVFLISVTVIPGSETLETADAIGTVVASVDFSNGNVATNNATFLNIGNSTDEPYTEAANIGGSNCRKIPAGKFMYIGFNRGAVPTSANNLMIDVTFWDDNSNAIWFNYNGRSNDYAGADFNRTASKGWATTTVVLTDAALSGKMRDGTDIRLGYGSSDVYVKSISVSIGSLNPDAEPVPTTPNSDSEFKGRTFAGYQMWHRAGNNASDWVHWSYGQFPAPGLQKNVNVCSWPDISIYPSESLYQTNLADLGDGRKAKLYSSIDPEVVKIHFDLMEKAGLDGVAVQRFVGGIGKTITKTEANHLDYVRQNSERTDRLFYICYDLNGAGSDILECLKNDWVYEIEQTRALTSSPNYATVNGKPVVEIWGIGYDFGISEQKMGQIIDFFHSRGCYLVAGTPRGWREGGSAYSLDLYKKIDCISPWTVGVYGNTNDANSYYNQTMIADNNYCNQNGMDYLPVCFAGSGNWVSENGTFSETDREGGKFLWNQVRNAKSLGLNAVYIAMFDEYEENTNILNSARDYFDIPTNEYFETISKNGIWASSDYYLRLVGAASKLLRGEIANTNEIPIPYSEGPLHFRNSFEYRDTVLFRSGVEKAMTLQIDPCFHDAGVVTNQNMGNANANIEKINGIAKKTGLYAAKLSGNANGNSEYTYRTNDTKILVKSGMTLSFSKYAANEKGKYTSVDLIFSDGSKLSNVLPEYAASNATGNVGSWTDVKYTIGKGAAVGKTITGIALSYKSNQSGDFTAYFDDVIIEESDVEPPVVETGDLYVSSVAPVETNIVGGDRVSYSATVRNLGNGAITTPVSLDFYADGKFLETVKTSVTINANGFTTVTTSNKYTVAFGMHSIKVFVNSDNAINDTDMSNNILKKRFLAED